MSPSGHYFDHETRARLTIQLTRVLHVMRDGGWRSLQEIADATGAPPASVSARLRDLRNKHAFVVEKVNLGKGLYLYSLSDPAPIRP